MSRCEERRVGVREHVEARADDDGRVGVVLEAVLCLHALDGVQQAPRPHAHLGRGAATRAEAIVALIHIGCEPLPEGKATGGSTPAALSTALTNERHRSVWPLTGMQNPGRSLFGSHTNSSVTAIVKAQSSDAWRAMAASDARV
eukprot:CAMPEP_0185287240 /NCGR_PEP_ID=MMETSP1363-20130426/2706_1 /TAXON_ID=38817 /ORGANISM="Gephyrocapsa oceanica, Strain RCC1303" /LENGTH=143 /DNA_ID=CAMNT_0027883075 /DNA_START=1757 /DNA_END=2189 /DNA_ORIENTATION=+